jgi:hypothetical protein
MKKLYQVVFVFFALFLLSNIASAQMTQYTWNEYDMQFRIPNSFNVDENSSSKFSAGDGNVWLTIYPQTGSPLTYDQMEGQLSSWAGSNGVSYNNMNTDLYNNGYWGVYIDGTAQNGLPVFIALYIHPDYPSQYFYVWINYKSDWVDQAAEVLKSFKPTI